MNRVDGHATPVRQFAGAGYRRPARVKPCSPAAAGHAAIVTRSAGAGRI